MRTSILVLIVVSVLGCTRESAPVAAAAPPAARPAGPPIPAISHWALDPENSSVEFVCKHVLSSVRGLFPKPAGTVTFDDATPANSKVSATIDVSGITTGVEERDTHLKSPDFFDAARYPAITFTASSFKRTGETTYSATGDVTMHGVTKPVTLTFTASPPFNHAGGIRRGIEATTSVNRRDFGILWDFPGEGTGVVVGDVIQITIDAELVLETGPSSAG